MKRLGLILATVGSLLVGTPGAAHATTGPAVVTGGTVSSYTYVWECGDFEGSSHSKYVFDVSVDLALRLDGRQQHVSLASTTSSPWMPCSSYRLPALPVTGTSAVGPSMSEEPVHGWCGETDRFPDGFRYRCSLSFDGRAPVVIDMKLVEFYPQCYEHGIECSDEYVAGGAA